MKKEYKKKRDDDYIVTEIGVEKRCNCCGEYYPMTNEFFYPNGWTTGTKNNPKPKQRRYTPTCKACFKETYRPTKPIYNISSKYEM